MFDQGLRFGRYTTGYSFAMGQAAQADVLSLSLYLSLSSSLYAPLYSIVSCPLPIRIPLLLLLVPING